ncbi:MAG: lysophospholipid acyltransferase family protein [Pseudomonadota bacterium]
MQQFIALFRAFRLALHIGYGLTMALVYPRLPAALRRRILQRWSADLLHVFNVELDAGELSVPHDGLIVSNHISWLDIFVLNAVVPMRFVAKSEVRRWPAIGWLCARANTLFIERGNARAAARINKQLGELMQQGECLAVFPEGTSTDGAQVAHFHAFLLQPAIDAKVSLHPIAIRYEDSEGERSTAAAYIDDISFGASLWTLFNTKKLHVRLLPAPALHAADFERRELAQRAHASISAALQKAESHKLHNALTHPQHSDTNLLPSTT